MRMTDELAREIAEDPMAFRQVAEARVAFLRKLAAYAARQDFHTEESAWAGEAQAIEEAVRGLGDE